jgi:hypothetical protein
VPVRSGWGEVVDRPEPLVTVGDDAEFAATAGRGAPGRGPATTVARGDLRRTLGIPEGRPSNLRTDPAATDPATGPPTVRRYEVDVVWVRLDRGDARPAVAHVVARLPWSRGGWLRGPLVAVMNVQFIGPWDVAPRGHPADGRVEVLEVDPSMRVRDRLAARSRLPNGTHVPHPSIATRSVRALTLAFDAALDVTIDGRRVGQAREMSIEVHASAATVYF